MDGSVTLIITQALWLLFESIVDPTYTSTYPEASDSPCHSPTMSYSRSVYSDKSDSTLVDSEPRCIYETRHMYIDMGPYNAGASRLSYGAKDNIVGSIRMVGGSTNIKSVSVTVCRLSMCGAWG